MKQVLSTAPPLHQEAYAIATMFQRNIYNFLLEEGKYTPYQLGYLLGNGALSYELFNNVSFVIECKLKAVFEKAPKETPEYLLQMQKAQMAQPIFSTARPFESAAHTIASKIQKELYKFILEGKKFTPDQLDYATRDRVLSSEVNAIIQEALSGIDSVLKRVPVESKEEILKKLRYFYRDLFRITFSKSAFEDFSVVSRNNRFNAWMYVDENVTEEMLRESLDRMLPDYHKHIGGFSKEESRRPWKPYFIAFNTIENIPRSTWDYSKRPDLYMNFVEWALCALYAKWDRGETENLPHVDWPIGICVQKWEYNYYY